MFKKIITLTSLLALPSMLFACKSPDNVFQICFNNNEPIDVAPIEKIGELNVSYFKAEDKPAYTFRSHYQPSVMIVLDAQNKTLNFTVDTSKVLLNIMKYDLCVRTELDWLVDAGIISIDRVKREKIEEKLKKYGGESRVFYTKQDTLIHSSYQLTSEGKFLPVDCIDAPSIINLPPKSIEISTGVHFKNRSSYSDQKVANTRMQSSATFDINGRSLTNNHNIQQSSSQLLLYRNAVSGTVHRSFSF